MAAADVTPGCRLLDLSPADKAARAAAKSPAPKVGEWVNLWRVPGRWPVWAFGHAPSTRWLVAVDDPAREVVALAAEPATRVDFSPVILEYASTAILVRCRDIRAGVNFK